MKRNQLVEDEIRKLFGMPTIDDETKEILVAISDHTKDLVSYTEMNESFFNKINVIFGLLFIVLSSSDDTSQDTTIKLTRYRAICDGFLYMFINIENEKLKKKLENEKNCKENI